MSRPTDHCRLCNQFGLLEKSHLMPAFAYGAVQKSEAVSPVLVTKTVTLNHMVQVKDYLLCRTCEDRFQISETYVSHLIRRPEKSKFPLLDLVKKGKHFADFDAGAAYHCSGVEGFDASLLAYFALSIAWRGSAHTWTSYDGNKFRPSPLGKYETEVAKFLLGDGSFPSNCAVWLHILDKEPGVALFTPVKTRIRDVHGIKFSIPGLRFVVLIGRQLRKEDRMLCILNGDNNPVCVIDGTRGELDQGNLRLINDSRPSVKFRKRLLGG